MVDCSQFLTVINIVDISNSDVLFHFQYLCSIFQKKSSLFQLSTYIFYCLDIENFQSIHLFCNLKKILNLLYLNLFQTEHFNT